MRKLFRVFVPVALVVTLGLMGWLGLGSPTLAPAQERPHPIPVAIPIRWEYKLLAYHPVLENMEKELNKVGQDGWEVSGVTSGPVQHVILKRIRR